MNFDRGPVLCCDAKKIGELRAILRAVIDDVWYADEPNLSRKFEDYRDKVREVLSAQTEQARQYLGDLPQDAVFAPSLISGVAGIWGKRFIGSRISVVVGAEVTDHGHARAKKLDRLTVSPVHVFCDVPAGARPLWMLLPKPAKDERGRRKVIELRVFDPLYAKIIKDDNRKVKQACCEAQAAFQAAEGEFLWLFGFDAEKLPSPSRVVAVSTNNATADNDPAIRRWLNVFAAILGEIATIERSMAVFLRTLQARTKVIKADEARWLPIVRALESRSRLEAAQKQLKAAEDDKAVLDALAGMLALLPKSRGIDAHRRSVMEMPHYDAPSLREALLQRRAFENSEAVDRSFRGILHKLNETFYARPLISFVPSPCQDKAVEKLENRRSRYFEEIHLTKYEERAELVLAHTKRLRTSTSLTATQVRILKPLSAIYSDRSLIVTCKYGEEFRRPALPEENECNFRWNAKQTVPVYAVLSALAKPEAQSLRELLRPPHLYWTHGDLHFHNILIDVGDLDDPLFKLIDANIDKDGRDITADFSKLLQSCDALGDFLHESLFDIQAFRPPAGSSSPPWRIDLKVGRGAMTYDLSGGASGAEVFRYSKTDEQLQHYRHIADAFGGLAQEGISALNGDSKWRTRAVFGLAMNLLTSPPFFIEDKPEMALAFAVSGAMVLTEWCRRKDVNILLAKAGCEHPSIRIDGYA